MARYEKRSGNRTFSLCRRWESNPHKQAYEARDLTARHLRIYLLVELASTVALVIFRLLAIRDRGVVLHGKTYTVYFLSLFLSVVFAFALTLARLTISSCLVKLIKQHLPFI